MATMRSNQGFTLVEFLVMDKSPVVLRVQEKKNLPRASVSPLFHVKEK